MYHNIFSRQTIFKESKYIAYNISYIFAFRRISSDFFEISFMIETGLRCFQGKIQILPIFFYLYHLLFDKNKFAM